MSLNDFYIYRISAKKKDNMEIYNQTLKDIFGKVLSWNEVKVLSTEDQANLLTKLEMNIKIEKSPYDVKKLANAIQNSRSGIGFQAFTEFECKFCSQKETWPNSATPGICKDCAKKMAENIVKYDMDILK